MRKICSLIVILVWVSVQTFAQILPLSDQAEISVLNMGPGNEVYAIWGHTAIRVQDPINGWDKVYNYGTFNFNTPNFTLKFLRGKLDYTLSVQHYYNTVAAYGNEGRWIQEQTLNLDQTEKLRLYELLEENYKPENRFYKYDFFFDNCATRPVNIIRKSIRDSVTFVALPTEKSFRSILDEHLTNDSWLDFGIDLIIGARADQIADPVRQMFMPRYVKEYFGPATKGTDVKQPLVAREKVVLEETKLPEKDFPFPFRPVFIFNLLLALEILLFVLSFRNKKAYWKVYDKTWFIVAGIASVFLLFMWFGTDHLATKSNWNLWWINPLFLIVVFPGSVNFKKWVFRLLTILLILLIACWTLIPQELNLAFLPIILILILKCIRYGFPVFQGRLSQTQ
ncbi:MAG TPA: DUF4105 domain-containing protein [Saprospiraceae bacterium]|nr:hypothetical protein [Saprospirales bacterium]HRQ28595.1 DUF4105 domain-containing protein [Saprospiraceae bacterium]